MRIIIREYEECMSPAVAEFNARLAAGSAPWRFSATATSSWLPRKPGRNIYQQFFLASDAASAVRGGYCIKHEIYHIAGEDKPIGQIALPLSEGVIDRRYAQVGAQLLLHAIRQQPLLYALGMGGESEPITHLVRAAHWRIRTLPFQFRIVRPAGFLRNITHLRRSRLSRFVLNMLAVSGLGWLAWWAVQLLMARRPHVRSDLQTEVCDEFGNWADDLWSQCAREYPYLAVRDAATLRILYPKENVRFFRIKVSESGRLLGWAVVLATDLSNHKQFGNMRLGSIVDALAMPAEAEKVTLAAAQLLCRKNVDLIISNQAHESWRLALRRCGFLSGPSNFLLATSPKLTEMLDGLRIPSEQFHLNRGDGDGPINL
jgi:hypothetical protein